MKVWFNTTFKGHYPVGSAAIVVAETRERATELLNIKLVAIGLKGNIQANEVCLLTTKKEDCLILSDGNY